MPPAFDFYESVTFAFFIKCCLAVAMQFFVIGKSYNKLGGSSDVVLETIVLVSRRLETKNLVLGLDGSVVVFNSF